ncbi:MAG TPA: YkgJ family cysteine cluster protein [Kofleriaceae bacterium]|nr:YkgJ family cysteine cluster protein [Kofleriaceae bacterium]
MSDDRDDSAFGTAAQDAPITRADFERALRYLNLSDLDLRDSLLKLAAQVVTLTDELVRRVDGVEPLPAPPNTPAEPTTKTIEDAVSAETPRSLMMIRGGDERSPGRVALDVVANKYDEPGADIPCAELVHLCKARCCSFTFSLSTQDLDEGVIRWDYGQPYLIRQRASDGYCVHHDPDGRGCTVHAYRPRICRVYDCRDDARIWTDYEQRIPAELPLDPTATREVVVDLVARVKARYASITAEQESMRTKHADLEPQRGPRAETTEKPKPPIKAR